jgi:hypothetical protein
MESAHFFHGIALHSVLPITRWLLEKKLKTTLPTNPSRKTY